MPHWKFFDPGSRARARPKSIFKTGIAPPRGVSRPRRELPECPPGPPGTFSHRDPLAKTQGARAGAPGARPAPSDSALRPPYESQSSPPTAGRMYSGSGAGPTVIPTPPRPPPVHSMHSGSAAQPSSSAGASPFALSPPAPPPGNRALPQALSPPAPPPPGNRALLQALHGPPAAPNLSTPPSGINRLHCAP